MSIIINTSIMIIDWRQATGALGIKIVSVGMYIIQLSEMHIKEQPCLKYQYKTDFKILIFCKKFSSFIY